LPINSFGFSAPAQEVAFLSIVQKPTILFMF
jgi:hypothetical protein